MSVRIHASTSQAAGLTYYTFNVANENGEIEARSFTNRAKAEQFLNEQKQKYPEASINNKPLKSSDPFNDGTFVDQSDTSGQSFQAPVGTGQKYDKNGNLLPAGQTETTVSVRNIGEDNPSVAAVSDQTNSEVTGRPARLSKEARDYCGLNQEDFQVIKSLVAADIEERVGGTLGGHRIQARVKRLNYECEHTIQGPDNNAFIVLGNDRTSDLTDPGHGEKGHTQCDAIDIVAGLGGYCPQEIEKIEVEDSRTGELVVQESPVQTNPNFYVDAARIYISQKTNCDRNFGIGRFGKKTTNSGEEDSRSAKDIGKYGGKSAVVAKADNIRLIGRESIRIVTGTDQFNSVGGKITGKHGIELIAMNKVEDLQPLVKGQNLALALTVMLNNIEAITEIFQAYVDYQMKFNKALSQHTHITPFYAGKSLPSEKAMVGGIQCDIDTMLKTNLSVIKQITNLQGVKTNFLSPSGDAYIMSRLNKTN